MSGLLIITSIISREIGWRGGGGREWVAFIILRDGELFLTNIFFIFLSFLRGVHISYIPVVRVARTMYHVFCISRSSVRLAQIIRNFNHGRKKEVPT
jgi:hypothetical protein